jgi:hypothetical protein
MIRGADSVIEGNRKVELPDLVVDGSVHPVSERFVMVLGSGAAEDFLDWDALAARYRERAGKLDPEVARARFFIYGVTKWVEVQRPSFGN